MNLKIVLLPLHYLSGHYYKDFSALLTVAESAVVKIIPPVFDKLFAAAIANRALYYLDFESIIVIYSVAVVDMEKIDLRL
jgi:hypothetical protein